MQNSFQSHATAIFLGLFFSVLFVYTVTLVFPPPNITNAAPGLNELYGWAWASNYSTADTGYWISFNCDNTATCATSNFKVIMNPSNGVLSGGINMTHQLHCVKDSMRLLLKKN
jgi:hypothetical protein